MENDDSGFELTQAEAKPAKPSKPRKPKAAPLPSPSGRGAGGEGDAAILSYRHPERRVNNPEVGMVTPATDPQAPKTVWRHDPHLDPSLQWTGKAERLSFAVDTVSLHVHERIDPMSILAAVRKSHPSPSGRGAGGEGKAAQKAPQWRQPGLFDAPFENLPLRDAIDFYRHDKGWSNRLIAGDSLLVMNSLLQKESMAGRVQTIYLDPPYGIKYGSNFQPFVNKRDVKDRRDEDLTQEPEMIKAFRDTWELGIHSYLTYLRDRLLLARELLSETGSVFVQISDENLHHVREVMAELFGESNFVSVITIKKTGAQTSNLLPPVSDYVVWYAKDIAKIKYRQPFREMKPGEGVTTGERYDQALLSDGKAVPASRVNDTDMGQARFFRYVTLSSNRPAKEHEYVAYPFNGKDWFPPTNRTWTTTLVGFQRVACAGRVYAGNNSLNYTKFLDDFPANPLGNLWDDLAGASDKIYVVQTNQKVIERCLLMTTDPGDLVLDPTCGSGTTAFVAEKWGRRWITCDTSRVAVTLAKQRLMTASYDYYELRYPHEGLKGGFIWKTVPHVTLKSIANNPEIDEIFERMHPAVEVALADLNAALVGWVRPQAVTHRPGASSPPDGGLRDKAANPPYEALREWEVPFDFPADWPEAARQLFATFHAARQAMQQAMDRSIAAHADQETLYDQPEKSKTKLRVTGPFSVEAVPFPTVLALDDGVPSPQPLSRGERGSFEADASIARSGETSRQTQWRDELLKTGIRGKGGQMLRSADLETLPGTRYLHASGHLETGERVVVSFGPEHAALEQRQVALALTEAGELFPLPKMIVFCAFAFDPEAAKDIDHLKGIVALKAQMNTDLLTEDLKKARAGNQSFWLMGQPDVEVRRIPSPPAPLPPAGEGRDWYEVEVHGFDYFDTAKGELISGGKGRIAVWSLDTDYDERSLFPRQVFFPLAGKGEGWEKLKRDIRAELDETALDAFHSTVSLPFAAGDNRKIEVKIVDDRGIESLRIVNLED